MARPRRQSKTTTSGSKPVGVLRITGAPPARTTTASTSTNKHVETAKDDINKLSIADLTLNTPLVPLRKPRRVPATPFHFLSLPSEIRIQIYEYFFNDITAVLDLGPGNYKLAHRKLGLMRVCKQVHAEATHYFYSTRKFRIFPTYPGKYFKSKRPILAKLKHRQRQCITSLELRLGPGWNAPPKGWVVSPILGLKDCVNVRTITVFVECDPGDNAFKGFRRSEGFYETFSCNLLSSILEEMPGVVLVEFDAYPSVKKSGDMMHGLIDIATQANRLIGWGPDRGWTDDMDENDTVDSGVHFIERVSIPEYGHHDLVVAA
ncbi:Fc.00g024720.m01.CDS01 [Cosmosporella sp. VM-42]